MSTSCATDCPDRAGTMYLLFVHGEKIEDVTKVQAVALFGSYEEAAEYMKKMQDRFPHAWYKIKQMSHMI